MSEEKIEVTEKVCSKELCTKIGVKQPIAEFAKNEGCKDGHVGECNTCKRTRQNAYTEINKKAKKEKEKGSGETFEQIRNRMREERFGKKKKEAGEKEEKPKRKYRKRVKMSKKDLFKPLQEKKERILIEIPVDEEMKQKLIESLLADRVDMKIVLTEKEDG